MFHFGVAKRIKIIRKDYHCGEYPGGRLVCISIKNGLGVCRVGWYGMGRVDLLLRGIGTRAWSNV